MKASRAISWVWYGWAMLSAVSAVGARIPWTSSKITGSPYPPSPYQVERRYPGLGFTNPVEVAAQPGSNRIWVMEQGGKIWSFPDRQDAAAGDLVIDLRRHHQPFDSAYSFVFHPGFETNRLVYVCYVEPPDRAEGSVISSFRLVRDGEVPRFDPASERVALRWRSGGHNGSSIKFGPDGMLYISTGDGAGPEPPDMLRTGQDVSDLLASILRIDVDGAPEGAGYAIPKDNPFVGRPGIRPEVYAYGFRNPWRIAFHPETGDLYVADVGWELWEMVYRVVSGGNYGWSVVEGPNKAVRADVTVGPTPILPPLMSHPHSEAASITGGVVSRGPLLRKLRGAYIYGDWETGKFWALRHEGDRMTAVEELVDSTLRVVGFGEDTSGELLVADYNGGLYRLAENPAAGANPTFPRKLSESGLFERVAELAPAAGVEPYAIQAPQWADHATAARHLGVPGSGMVRMGDKWVFPQDTVLTKTLSLAFDERDPSSVRKVETQVLHFDGQAWQAYSHRWNDTGTEAELVPREGADAVFTVRDPRAPEGRRRQPWRFASAAECLRCHNPWSGNVLAFNLDQLNTGAGSEGGELRRLADAGLLDWKAGGKELPRLARVDDATASVEHRARTWLHANCAHCHRWGAGGSVPTLLNHELALKDMKALDLRPLRGDFGMVEGRVIAPGDPLRSALFFRISTESGGRMPLIGSRLVDRAGVDLVGRWIQELKPAPDAADALKELARVDRERWEAAARVVGGGSEQSGAAKSLLGSIEGGLALARALDQGPAGGDLRPDWVEAIRDPSKPAVRDLLQRFLPESARREVLGTSFAPDRVLSLKGDPDRGRRLFGAEGGAQCGRCHQIGGEGRAFGPDLAQTAKRYSRAELLEHMIQPSKLIAPEFQTVTIELPEDREVTGFVVERTADELVIRTELAGDVRLKRTEIKSERLSAISAMPEGLLASLTAQEAADLIEFLKGL